MTAVSINIKAKRYPGGAGGKSGHLALSDTRFEVNQNEFVCVLGPSGCGKTTLLNLIAGIDKSYDGEITLSAAVSRSLAYVFQTPRLLPWRTAAQNVELAIDGGASSSSLSMDLLAAVGIEKFAANYPGELSLGMQRRVSLARAFARRPSLMLMDEPFVSLDPDAARELRRLLKQMLVQQPATIIFVTHDHREAVQLADRIVVMSGAPAKVVKQVRVLMSDNQRNEVASVDEFIEKNLTEPRRAGQGAST
ncbi:MAG: ATP-binding cassette domain-containing protein [Hyphomicrobiales bacterium]|nr:ATP-binding cassette domain-containing protein [Hyphomicrobiales bacterium]